jgi:cytochrome b
MLSRLLARLVTGPVGFFVAGALDLGAAWGGWALSRARARARARLPLKAR